MKRRNLLTYIAGLFALPFVPKAEANRMMSHRVGINENEPDHYSYRLCKINTDGSVIPMSNKEADEMHADFMKNGFSSDYTLTPKKEQELIDYCANRRSHQITRAARLEFQAP
jgi:hypothetical protein